MIFKSLKRLLKEYGASFQKWLLPVVQLGFAGLYLYVMKPAVTGLFYDDGMYLMSGTGFYHQTGYRLSGMIGQPLFFKYPPFFPLFLSNLMFFIPAFPESIVWLKAFNILIAVSGLWLVFHIAQEDKKLSIWLSLGALLLLGTNSRYVEIATELMSEPLYFVSSLWILTTTELSLRENKALNLQAISLLVVISSIAFYTRTIGILLILAITLYLALRGFKKQAGIYLSACLACMTPLLLWSARQPNLTVKYGEFLIRSFQESYFQSFQFDLTDKGGNLLSLYADGFNELLGNFSVQFFPALGRLLLVKESPASALLILGTSFALALILGMRLYRHIKVQNWSASGIYVCLYLLVLPFWSYYKVYPRFLLMVLPFLWLALIHTVQENSWQAKSKQWTIAGLLIVTLGSNLWQWSPAFHKANPNQLLTDSSVDLWADYKGAADYLANQTPSNARIATEAGDEAYFYALYGHRQALDSFVFLPASALEKACPKTTENRLTCLQYMIAQKAETTYQLWQKQKIQYVVQDKFTFQKNNYNNGVLQQRVASIIPQLQNTHPNSLTAVYSSPDSWITIYHLATEAPKNDAHFQH